MLTECNQESFEFHPLNGREVTGRFDGGTITSDAGGLQAAQGGGRTGLWTDQGAARVSEISAARAGERGGGMEADLRHPQPAETFPLRMDSAERLKAA